MEGLQEGFHEVLRLIHGVGGMEEPRAVYRYRIIDGPTRQGTIEIDDIRSNLPVLLDQSMNDPWSLFAVAGDPTWSGREFRITGSQDDLPAPLKEAFSRELGRMSADSFLGHIMRSTYGLKEVRGSTEWNMGTIGLPFNPILIREPWILIRTVLEMRDLDPAHPPLYLPGAAGHGNLEFLIYIGIEMIDTQSFRLDGLRGFYHTISGPIAYNKMMRSIPPTSLCSCEACRSLEDEEASVSHTGRLLANHNASMAARRMNEALVHLKEGTLRERLMSSLAGNPEWMSALRILERDGANFFLKWTPSYRKVEKVKVTYREDIHSPDHQLWRSRIQEVYEPVTPRPLMLFLPCSARKPYSTSRTHARINGVLSSLKGWRKYIHRIVVTSPLGLVPLELEDLYPASYYDIPVTGDWHEDEIDIVREMTKNLVLKEGSEKIILHHGQSDQFYPEGLHDDIFNGIDVIDIKKLSNGNDAPDLGVLRSEVQNSIGELKEKGINGEDDDIRSLISFSLGCSVDTLSDLYVRNTRNGRSVFWGKKPVFDLKKGGPVPTKIGGPLLWERGHGYRGRAVLIEDFVPRGTIFGQGVIGTEGDIHPGDIVLVGTESGYRGVGRALVDAKTMITNVPGPAVEMLHHVKG